MPESQVPFLNRTAELKRLRYMVQQGKSVLIHGAAGIGKSALLDQLRRHSDHTGRTLLLTPGNCARSPWLRDTIVVLAADRTRASRLAHWLKLRPTAGPRELETVLDKTPASTLHTLLVEVLTNEPFALVLDPLEFMSRQLFELLRELEQTARTPLVLVARSPHMEAIGNATRFYWPRDQHLALGPLRQADVRMLFDFRIASWEKLPENLEEFRRHILEYANGNPGILLRLLDLACAGAYWSGNVLKSHVLTVDFNMGSFSSRARS